MVRWVIRSILDGGPIELFRVPPVAEHWLEGQKESELVLTFVEANELGAERDSEERGVAEQLALGNERLVSARTLTPQLVQHVVQLGLALDVAQLQPCPLRPVVTPLGHLLQNMA